MKKILFIYRSYKLKPSIKKKRQEAVINNFCNADFGFLLLTLKYNYHVDFIFGLEEAKDLIISNYYDLVFIDIKEIYNNEKIITRSFFFKREVNKNYLLFLRKKIKTDICFFSSSDGFLINNPLIRDCMEILEPKLIYFPNLFKDRDKYNLNNEYKYRLKSTFYGLGYLDIVYHFNSNTFSNFDLSIKKNDLFFSGSVSNSLIRKEVVKFLNQDDFINLNIICDLNKNLKKKIYIEKILSSKINLALSGNLNNITYRHNEILFFKSLMLCDAVFLQFEISNFFTNPEYFCFNSNEELKDLIFFYLSNENKIKEMSFKLNKEFRNFYCPIKQSKIINKDLFNV
jgi:hypothetical protein